MFGEIRNSLGEKIDYSYHAGRADNRALVVIGHGVTANKDRPFAQALAGALEAAGLHALRISFSGNGDSEGRFEDSTISKEVEDLGSVLNRLDEFEIGYAGHSMGGAVGVLRTARDSRIRFLISLAGMVETADFARRKFDGVEPGKGFMWDKPDCPLSQTYLDDMHKVHSVIEHAEHIRVPWLLVHGNTDTVVPIQDSLDIFERAHSPKKLITMENVDHVFSDGAAPIMASHVVTWMQGGFQ